ncbi:MAG: hypothetical protein LPK07_03560 [Hymenobacteraceae bacterium]|nr:hypothetical protein [Hymenobacteraceae bacterium]
MKKYVVYLLALMMLLASVACKEVEDIKAFTEANYRLHGVEDVKLNGIDLHERIEAKQALTNEERDSLLAAITGNTLLASSTMALQVDLKEPSEDRSLTVTRLEWLLLVNGKEALTGTIEDTMVLREGLNTIPVETPILLTEVDGQPNYEGLSRVINLVSKRADIQKSVTLQIKPTIKTPLGEVESPTYITVSRPQNS